MRERGWNDPLVETGLNVYSRVISSGQLTNHGWVYWKHSSGAGRIQDVPKTAYVEYQKRMRRRAFKAVLHETWSGRDLSTPQWVRTSDNTESYCSASELLAGHHEIGYPDDHCGKAYELGMNPPSGLMDVGHGHYERWLNIKPTMATRTNLGVFLYELRDFKRMWDFIPAKHLLVQGVKVQSWGPVMAWWNRVRNFDPSFSSLTKYANSQHLNYNFGWKPFVSDILKCWRGLESFEKRLNRFQRDAGKELRKRFRDSPRLINEQSLTAFVENPFWRKLGMWDIREQHASAFDFTYLIPQYSSEEMRWRALADSLGMKLTPSAVWAGLPWSFVVDWFFNVGGFLQSYETDWLQPFVKLHQGCFSRKVEGQCTLNVKSSDAYGGVILPGPQVQFSHYSRKVGLPTFSAATDDLDADKIRLGSSLLLSLFQG